MVGEVAAGLALVVILAGCGGGMSESGAAPACSSVVRERLDPATPLHLLPGAPEPTYLSNPPTSGPHRSGRPPSGVVDAPLDNPTQVSILEAGGILIQYESLPPRDVARLVSLAGDQVVVAPGRDLPTSVVATAWLVKRTCSALDLDALRAFVSERLGHAPGRDGSNP